MPQASDLGLVSMKRAIHCVLRRRLKSMSRNTSKLTGEQLSKTKGNLKDGTPSNHLEERGKPRF